MSILNWFRKTPPAVDDRPETTASEILLQGTVNQYLRNQVAELTSQVHQLKFLLDSAPMMNMVAEQIRASRLPFAYVHPKTISPHTWGMPPSRWYKFHGSPTLWIPLSSMPEGRVIFSSLQIPGLENSLGL